MALSIRVAAFALAGVSTLANAALRPMPAATPNGAAESCIPIVQIESSEVRSDSVIDFRMRGGKVYRNTLPSSCSQLGFERSFSYKTSLSQLCSVDIITVLDHGGPGGLMSGASCGLGEFQPVTLAK